MSANSKGCNENEKGDFSKYSIVAKNVSVTYKTRQIVSDRSSGNILRRYGVLPTINRKYAVKNVSFTAEKGESVGIVGRNGSGKSSLLRALSGLEPLTSGETWSSSQPVFLGVSPALIPHRTGIENIRIGLLAMGLDSGAIEDTISAVVELADLGESINDPISTYSAGMGSRLRFSITASAPSADILMIDEALGAGDAAFQAKSEEAMEKITDGAGTIFFVSHVPQLVERICKRALWIFEGEVIMDGPANEVPELYRRWAVAVKKRNFEEASARLNEARSTYKKPDILIV